MILIFINIFFLLVLLIFVYCRSLTKFVVFFSRSLLSSYCAHRQIELKRLVSITSNQEVHGEASIKLPGRLQVPTFYKNIFYENIDANDCHVPWWLIFKTSFRTSELEFHSLWRRLSKRRWFESSP